MSDLSILRYWAIDVIMKCNDKELLDFVHKLMLHEYAESE